MSDHTPAFTAQEMRDLTSSPEISPTTHGICHTQMCSEERCGTCSRKAAIRAALHHAATVLEENEQLRGELAAGERVAKNCTRLLSGAEADLAVLRAVIQQELDTCHDPVDSLRNIAAAGLWLSENLIITHQHKPLLSGDHTQTLSKAMAILEAAEADRVALMREVKRLVTVATDQALALEANAKEIARLTAITQAQATNEKWEDEVAAHRATAATLASIRAAIQRGMEEESILDALDAIVLAAGLWPKGEQVPECSGTPERPVEGHVVCPQCRPRQRQAAPRYTPDDKLHAAADLERAMADVLDMLRAEFDVVKKAIAMVEARQRDRAEVTQARDECQWLGDLLAVLRGDE